MYQESLDNDLESDQRRNNIEEGEIGVSEALEPVENEESTEIDRNNITAQENETGDSGNEETDRDNEDQRVLLRNPFHDAETDDNSSVGSDVIDNDLSSRESPSSSQFDSF